MTLQDKAKNNIGIKGDPDVRSNFHLNDREKLISML